MPFDWEYAKKSQKYWDYMKEKDKQARFSGRVAEACRRCGMGLFRRGARCENCGKRGD